MSEQGEIRLGSYTAAVDARLAHWQGEAFRRASVAEGLPAVVSGADRGADRPAGLARPARHHDGRGAAADALCARGGARGDPRRRGARHGRLEPRPRGLLAHLGAAFGHPALHRARQHPSRRRPGACGDASTRRGPSSWCRASRARPPRCSATSATSGSELARAADRGEHFVAVTDPGTPLETLARERGFRGVFNAPPDVGGRYSALTPFGLVPAALLGVTASSPPCCSTATTSPRSRSALVGPREAPATRSPASSSPTATTSAPRSSAPGGGDRRRRRRARGQSRSTSPTCSSPRSWRAR